MNFLNLSLAVCSVLIIFSCDPSSGSKILVIFPTPGKSHWIVGNGVARALSDAGHDVTMISAYSSKIAGPKFHDIILEGLEEEYLKRGSGFNSLILGSIPLPLMYYTLYQMGFEVVDIVMKDPGVIKLMKSNEKFDLVIYESFSLDSLLGFAHYYGVPAVAVSTFGASKWTNDVIGNPAPLSYVPHPFLSYTDHMTFGQRFMNAWTYLMETALINIFYLPKAGKLYDQYFPDPKPAFADIYKNVSMVFLNNHVTTSTAKPYLPNMIEIGGIQIDRKGKPLPENLQKFMDSAKDGVIYFSMGTNIKGIHFGVEEQQAFIRVFGRLKQKVIWKFENETLENRPENVMISSWLPQSDVLGHPNVKLFITHGGLLGTTESVYHGVPIIGIPVFGDQELNIARAVTAGWGYRLPLKNLTESSIESAINEVLNNEKYRENMKIVSKRYRGQSMTPQETVVYWSEYLINNQGAPHLRSASQDLNFIEYHMIDVFFVMLVIAVVLSIVSLVILKKISKKIFNKFKKTTKTD